MSMFQDIPVEVGVIYEGERIRRKDMHIELGGPYIKEKFELIEKDFSMDDIRNELDKNRIVMAVNKVISF